MVRVKVDYLVYADGVLRVEGGNEHSIAQRPAGLDWYDWLVAAEGAVRRDAADLARALGGKVRVVKKHAEWFRAYVRFEPPPPPPHWGEVV